MENEKPKKLRPQPVHDLAMEAAKLIYATSDDGKKLTSSETALKLMHFYMEAYETLESHEFST